MFYSLVLLLPGHFKPLHLSNFPISFEGAQSPPPLSEKKKTTKIKTNKQLDTKQNTYQNRVSILCWPVHLGMGAALNCG